MMEKHRKSLEKLRARAAQLKAEWLAFGSPEAADDAIQSLVPDLLARLTEVESRLTTLARVEQEMRQAEHELSEGRYWTVNERKLKAWIDTLAALRQQE